MELHYIIFDCILADFEGKWVTSGVTDCTYDDEKKTITFKAADLGIIFFKFVEITSILVRYLKIANFTIQNSL